LLSLTVQWFATKEVISLFPNPVTATKISVPVSRSTNKFYFKSLYFMFSVSNKETIQQQRMNKNYNINRTLEMTSVAPTYAGKHISPNVACERSQ